MVTRKFIVQRNGTSTNWEVVGDGPDYEVRREGEEEWHQVRLDPGGYSGFFVLTVDDRPRELYLERIQAEVQATVGRHVIPCRVDTWHPRAGRGRSAGPLDTGEMKIKAPMTGSVVEVTCAVGEQVPAGAVVMVIESMKMNNELRAPSDAVVVSIAAGAGDRVTAGQTLVVLEALPTD